MSAIDFALRLAGMPQQTIDELNGSLPAAASLIKLFKDNEPLIRKFQALAAEAQPLIDASVPLLRPAMAELDALLPAAQDVVAFLKSKQSA